MSGGFQASTPRTFLLPAIEQVSMTDNWGENPALLVVDVSRKRADPSLDTAYADIVEAAEQIADLLEVTRELEVPIFFSRGGKSYYLSGGADLEPVERKPWTNQDSVREESPEQASRAFELAPQLDRRGHERLITKRTPSAFFESPLAAELDAADVDTVVVTGIMTSCCVRATVEDAFAHRYQVVVPEQCVADRRPAANAFHLAEFDQKFGDVVDVEAVKSYLQNDR